MREMPKKVVLSECWARDGLQNQSMFVDTDIKLKMIDMLVDAGFRRLEVTSFSHPKYVPQFADAETLLKRLDKKQGVSYKATCVNKKALERAIETVKAGYGPTEVSMVIAASEAYNQTNVRMSRRESLNQMDEMIRMAKDHKLEVLISLSTVFGLAKGEVDIEDVLQLVRHFSSQEIDRISIGDTTGMGNPEQVYRLFCNLKQQFPDIQFVAHFHDTKGWGIANACAALQAGIDYFDVSLGGVGGPPAQRMTAGQGHTGNLCTEDFVFLLADLGIDCGIDLDKLIAAGKFSEEVLGRQRSQILRMYDNE
jgi:hydroxymethylglutaryl-CoA lyase